MYAFRVCFGLRAHECNTADIDEISWSIESGGPRQEFFISDNGGGDKSSLIGASNFQRSSQASLRSGSCSWFDLDQFSGPAAPKLSKSHSKGRLVQECTYSTYSNKVDKYDLESKKSASKKPMNQVNMDILHLQKQYDILKQSFEMLNSSTMIHRGKDTSSSTTNKVKVRRYPTDAHFEDLVKPSRERKKAAQTGNSTGGYAIHE